MILAVFMAYQDVDGRAALSVLLTAGAVMSIVLLIRNRLVYNYRNRLVKEVGKVARADIDQGREWLWRYDAYQEVSYNAMFWQFWRRLDSFYPDRRFLE